MSIGDAMSKYVSEYLSAPGATGQALAKTCHLNSGLSTVLAWATAISDIKNDRYFSQRPTKLQVERALALLKATGAAQSSDVYVAVQKMYAGPNWKLSDPNDGLELITDDPPVPSPHPESDIVLDMDLLPDEAGPGGPVGAAGVEGAVQRWARPNEYLTLDMGVTPTDGESGSYFAIGNFQGDLWSLVHALSDELDMQWGGGDGAILRAGVMPQGGATSYTLKGFEFSAIMGIATQAPDQAGSEEALRGIMDTGNFGSYQIWKFGIGLEGTFMFEVGRIGHSEVKLYPRQIAQPSVDQADDPEELDGD